jgi:adenine-specific DNA-methyltransferase
LSRITDLITQIRAKDAQLGTDLEREFKALSARREFGLNFERHRPEAVELSQRPVRKGDKVRVLPERGSTKKGEQQLWLVKKVQKGIARTADLELFGSNEPEYKTISVDDLVVVAEFRDIIYPGLVSTGKVERGGDKPFHTVINAENYHALKALSFTHRGKVDAIYIDPPYNSGARDWKYNNDYVEKDDLYRHSKWLAMMERRLLIAKDLLNPADSVLIVTIDEKEYLRLGLLLEQTFPEATIQMISSQINPKGVSREGSFRRSDEYIFFLMFGVSRPARLPLSKEWSTSPKMEEDGADEKEEDETESQTFPDWTSMMRRGSEARRVDRLSMFYPIYADPGSKTIIEVGEPIPEGKHEAPPREGLVAILPLRRDGSEGRWQLGRSELILRIKQGRVRLGRNTAYGYVVNYLPDGAYAEVMSDSFSVRGKATDGSLIAVKVSGDSARIASTQWKIASHNASENGSTLLESFIPKRKFPFPKSLYAVEDALRFFVKNKQSAVVLDFFSGSGTTAHAVMRLNRQDGGSRQCISVTNNEVAPDEAIELRKRGLRPGDDEWERYGVCDYITKPRIESVITGRTSEGKPIKGEYRFTDPFPMAEGFTETAEFFTLTYETPIAVTNSLAFSRIAALLWLRAGGTGARIEKLPLEGWQVVDSYALLTDLDQARPFAKAVAKAPHLNIAYIVTDDERRFQSIVRSLSSKVEPVRLYESYLTNFGFASGE